MTGNDHPVSQRYLTPTSIRDETFHRRMRGLDADQVYAYLDALADQVQATEVDMRHARAENERLHTELRRLQAESDEHQRMSERVNEQVVQMFSQAQLIAEEMVDDVSRDARERIAQARAHERKVVEEAMSTAGHQVRSYARTAQAQMQAIMESFASEVDRLGSSAASVGPDAASPTPGPSDPLFDDLSKWPIRVRNGSGHRTPGSD